MSASMIRVRERLALWLAPWIASPPSVVNTPPDQCNWCNQNPLTDCPRMAVEAHFIVRGDDDDEVLGAVRHFGSWLSAVPAAGAGTVLPQDWTLGDGVVRSGYRSDGRRSVTVYRRDITPEQYRAEADAWLERKRDTP